MIRATRVLGQHRWQEAAADTVVLDFDDRHRRRVAMTGTRGLEFLLDLENAIALRGGDALVLEDGRLIEVVAAPQPLLEIRGTDPLPLIMTSIATTITTATITPMLMTTSEPVLPEARRGMTDDEAAALYRLMTWLSPSFPVGAFSYSSGVEWAVEAGDITDAASLRDWLSSMLADGSGFCDAVFLAQAHRGVSWVAEAALRDVAEL